jgi:hypothetical protein
MRLIRGPGRGSGKEAKGREGSVESESWGTMKVLCEDAVTEER